MKKPQKREPKKKAQCNGSRHVAVEVIDHTDTGEGVAYTKWVDKPFNVELMQQDDGRMLKVILS